MSNTEKILSKLREENPFVSSSVGDPRENRYQDVASINHLAFEGLYSLICQKAKNPILPCAGLVFGETGSGKTHLIGRILNIAKTSEIPFSVAYIHPIEDAQETYRYLLREIVVNLCQPEDNGTGQSQLDLMVARIVGDIGCENPEFRHKHEIIADELGKGIRSVFAKEKQERVRELFRFAKSSFKLMVGKSKPEPESVPDVLRARFPDIPKIVFQVLLQYPCAEKRTAVLDWLKGRILDEAESERLQIPDRINKSPAMLEQEARDILLSLGILMSACQKPLVACFDRLENYDTDDKIRALGKMIEFLTDHAKAILPVVFVRGQQWWEIFSHKLNQQVITRIQTNSFTLKGCDEEQASELIRHRLASIKDESSDDSLFPFDKEWISAQFRRSLSSPREVIIAANERLKTILYHDTPQPGLILSSNRLKDEFDKLCLRIQNSADCYPPDRNRLRRALNLYLTHLPSDSGIEIQDMNRPDDKYTDLLCKRISAKQGMVGMAFFIDNELNHSAVRACLNRALETADHKTEAVYIRDDRCPIPSQWKSTTEVFKKFLRRGKVVLLDQARSSRWYALALLDYEIRESDIALSSKELALFIQEEIYRKKDIGFQELGEILKGE